MNPLSAKRSRCRETGVGVADEYSQTAANWLPKLKTTPYFDRIRSRPDRAFITDQWIMQVMQHPERASVQPNGRIRKWGKIAEMGGRYLRVVVLPDGETVHNAFLDRNYRP